MSTSAVRRPRRLAAAVLSAVTLGLAGVVVATPALGVPAPVPTSAGLSVSAAASAAGHPRGHWRHHRRAGYLALGDSVPFGYRPPEVTPPADYLDASNFRGYPEILARHAHLRLVNASCPGETTESMMTFGAQSNGCENALGSPYGYRSAYPLHASYDGTQLAYAVAYLRAHPHTRLVTLTIGANDLFLCQDTNADGCTGSDFPALVAQVGANVDTILSTLRHEAHYRHRLTVLTYYSLDYGDAAASAGIAALDAGLAAAAQANGAVVADGYAAFARATAAYDGDACAAGLLIALPAGGCNVHPTLAGHRVLARAIGATLRRR